LYSLADGDPHRSVNAAACTKRAVRAGLHTASNFSAQPGATSAGDGKREQLTLITGAMARQKFW